MAIANYLAVHYLDNALLGVHGLDELWLGDVRFEYSVCNIKITAWHHTISIHIYTYIHAYMHACIHTYIFVGSN